MHVRFILLQHDVGRELRGRRHAGRRAGLRGARTVRGTVRRAWGLLCAWTGGGLQQRGVSGGGVRMPASSGIITKGDTVKLEMESVENILNNQ